MPAYDFRCTECAETFEVIRSMNATGEQCCPTCGAIAKKVFSPVGVAFKGTGFHNTDYRTRPKEDAAKSDAASDAAPCAAKTEGSSACSNCPAASD